MEVIVIPQTLIILIILIVSLKPVCKFVCLSPSKYISAIGSEGTLQVVQSFCGYRSNVAFYVHKLSLLFKKLASIVHNRTGF